MSLSFNEDPVFLKVKKAILARGGPSSFKTVVRSFRIMDQNDDHELDSREFDEGMKRIGASLTKQETVYLTKAFDKNNDGKVSVDEFVRQLIGGLNPRRHKLVERAFAKFDKTGDEAITTADLKGTYDCSRNPLVLRGEKTEEEVMRDFLLAFDDEVNPDGKVTKEEFFAYYAGLSASIPHDDFFEAMMLKTWKLDDPKKPRLDSTQREWGPEGDPLAVPDTLLMSSGKSSTLYSGNTKHYDGSHMKRQPQPHQPNPTVRPNYVSTTKSSFTRYDSKQIAAADPIKERSKDLIPFSPTGNPVVDEVRKKCLQRAGKEGFTGLRRVFRIMDKDRNARLSKDEVSAGLQRYGIKLTPLEISAVMKFVDRDGSGHVSVTEFLRAIRGPLTNEKRLSLIKIAFDRLDADGSGVVSLQEIGSKYDVTQHPMVLEKKKTPEQVLQEFISDWDKSGDGLITFDEWVDYYGDISCGIDDDQYFELMIRNAWHISGGVGVAANTSCRRVLVIFVDDTQKVVEIKDDLGMRADDLAGMKRKLEAQGLRNIKQIKLYG